MKLLYYVFVYICLWTITALSYSLFHKQFFYPTISNLSFWILTFLELCLFYFLFHKSKKKAITLLILACLCTKSLCTYFPFMHLGNVPSFEKEIIKKIFLPTSISSNRTQDWKGNTIVAHSLGAIDGHRVTPSIETFKTNYLNGFTAFEVDFVLTSDGYLVCRHLWENPDLQKGIDELHIPTLAQFKNTPILDTYTPMSFQDLCTLLLQYEDAWIVTDSKEASTKEVEINYKKMIEEANNIEALNVLNRFIIQVYDKEMYQEIQSIYPFQNYIYATYRDWHGDIVSFVDICAFCNQNKINSISMWNYYYCDEIQEIADAYDLDLYIHTENDVASAKRYIRMGAKGIYTDFILPSQLAQ